MTYLVYVTLFVICGSSSFVEASELDYDGWLQIRLWHALNDEPEPVFTERGNITISSVRSGASTVAQMGLQQAQMQSLKSLAERNGKYRMKAVVRGSSGNEMTYLTSVPACRLLGAGLEDTITIWLDSAVEPVAVNLLALGPCVTDVPPTKMWSTNVNIRYPDGGPVPDTATFIQRLEREREAKERAESKDNQSYLAKYWMYIIPVLIVVILSAAANPEMAANEAGGSSQRQ